MEVRDPPSRSEGTSVRGRICSQRMSPVDSQTRQGAVTLGLQDLERGIALAASLGKHRHLVAGAASRRGDLQGSEGRGGVRGEW